MTVLETIVQHFPFVSYIDSETIKSGKGDLKRKTDEHSDSSDDSSKIGKSFKLLDDKVNIFNRTILLIYYFKCYFETKTAINMPK